ncbi:hypothetical protein K466DRAFT_253890 [Polyporus arcularius HHB13444]|uniref:Uncharacterized protein n=1 Tax=Polyporus arcularius HHB13444 TaxID=1314778 RepID=A0A5C3P2G5_9APHY|nr:hypothetical protein K466DRAFT_253890 [Polyporus arcularius HHB13444]
MTGSDFSTVLTSEFVSFTFETLLVGILVVTYSIALCILLIRNRARWSTASFIASTAMLLLALAHWVLDIHQCYTGFVVYGGTTNATAKYLANTHSPVFIAKSVLYVTQTLFGDAFVAYRIYILWNRSWAVAIGPILLICAAAVTGYASCCMLSQDVDGQDLTMNTPYSGLFLAFLSVATCYTVFTTALVAIRIYRWKRRARHYNPYVPIPRRRVLETFIQSAAIYPVVLISLFVTYVLGVNPEMFGVDLLPALIGIASTLITIRLGIVDVTEGRSVQNVKLSVRRASAYPRMFEEQYSLRRPPPSMSPIFEPREDSKESLITTGDPLRSSSATGFGQDLLLAVQRVLDLDGAPSYETDSVAYPAALLRVDEPLV